MNILITGGSGFVGNQIVKKLCFKHKLTLLLRKPPKIPNKKIKYIITKNIFEKKKKVVLQTFKKN